MKIIVTTEVQIVRTNGETQSIKRSHVSSHGDNPRHDVDAVRKAMSVAGREFDERHLLGRQAL